LLGTLKAGVPQGSVVGSLLFLPFINDIADDIQSLVRLFADDSSLIFSSTSLLANFGNPVIIIAASN
jgi:hypothetical protein